jgi:hypothetical protein
MKYDKEYKYILMKILIFKNPIISLHVFMIKNKLFENDNCDILDEFNDLLNYEKLDIKHIKDNLINSLRI